MAVRTEASYGLVPFRLTDVPLELRTRAASAMKAVSDRALPEEQSGEAGLLGAIRSFREVGAAGKDALEKAAVRPSGKVYWIPRPAWERVMRR